MDIRVFMPETAQDVLDYAEEIKEGSKLYLAPNEQLDPDLIDWLKEHPHTIYLFYSNDEFIGMIRLDDREIDPTLGKNTVEIFGGVIQGNNTTVSNQPVEFVLSEAFKVKKTVIAKILPENKGAIGFVRKWGFKKINTEQGHDVYRLRRSEFKRLNDA